LGAPGFARRPATRQNAAVMDFLAADDFFILLPLDRLLPVGAHFEPRAAILPVFHRKEREERQENLKTLRSLWASRLD
jgi:hypothetical protein